MIIKTITSPLASLVILILGTHFFQMFTSMSLHFNEYSSAQASCVHTFFYFGIFISALSSEQLIHRIGHIRAFTTFTAIITAMIILQAFHHNILLWCLTRFCTGLSLAALYVTIESWLLAESSVEDRGKNLALYMICLYGAQTFSPQLLKLVDIKTLQPYLIAALMCALSNIPVSLTYKLIPNLPQRIPLKIIPIFKLSPYGFIGCFISGIVLSLLYSYIPNFAIEHNINVDTASSILIAGGFLMQWPLSKLANIGNRHKILISLGCLTIIPGMFMALFPDSHPNIILINLFIIGGLSFVIYPIAIALTCDRIENTCIIQATGVLLFSYGLGSVSGPSQYSLAKKILPASMEPLFTTVTLFIGCYGLFGAIQWIMLRLRPPPNIEDTVECLPIPHQSPLANQLDPRQLEKELGD